MVLSHRAGLSGVRAPLTPADIYDWPKMTTVLAEAEPLWEPGSTAGYHAITWGFLVGELVRRVTGHSIGQFLSKEIAGPLRADFAIGIDDNLANPIADLIPPKGPPAQTLAEPSEILRLTLGNPTIEAHRANDRDWRKAEIPAANGHGNAEGLARIYGALANGGRLDDFTLMTSATIRRATREVFRGVDMNLGTETRWSLGGFYLNNIARWYGPNDESFGHSGWGGSSGYADPKAKLGVGYVANQMDTNLQGDPRSTRLIAAIYDCL
jgi:CubicO group peptidase (beta-lactamase class C family)